MNETCRELLHQSYPASAVFVTFQTEECQRRVLKALRVGSIYVATNDSSHIEDPNHVFCGKLVLDVEEVVEPSAIRWKDFNKSMTAKVLQRICTGAITIALIGFGFFCRPASLPL
mmetsp:Transcript_19235/g.34822  ORF Transcript_19235/g.34822 Transcript_19235/m.34822 type:complete len:115 (+) Transcript_19235:1158-1502(+)